MVQIFAGSSCWWFSTMSFGAQSPTAVLWGQIQGCAHCTRQKTPAYVIEIVISHYKVQPLIYIWPLSIVELHYKTITLQSTVVKTTVLCTVSALKSSKGKKLMTSVQCKVQIVHLTNMEEQGLTVSWTVRRSPARIWEYNLVSLG